MEPETSVETVKERPKLVGSSRLFGRLAGATLSAAAKEPKTESEIKRKLLEEKLQAKLAKEKEELRVKMVFVSLSFIIPQDSQKQQQREQREEQLAKERQEWTHKKVKLILINSLG
jgi:hypothetical protein